MIIVWDEPKRAENIAKHGFDFAELELAFFDEAVFVQANMGRIRAIGPHRNIVIAVVFGRLGTEAISIVSMRPASRKERST